MSEKFAREFITQSVDRINQNTPKIIRCINELEEAEVWRRPNNASNSIGNLVLHLCGNITQYIISSIGEKEDIRQRDEEFSATGGYLKSALIFKLTSIVEEATTIINNMNAEDLLGKRSVQGFQSSGMGNIIQVTEHYSYHTGQIVFWTKLVTSKDLGFYAGIDLNKKNEI
jgi:hypothetical protein